VLLAIAGVAAAVAIGGCGNAGTSPTSGSGTGTSGGGGAATTSRTNTKDGSGGRLVVGMTAANIPALDTALTGGQGNEGIRFVGLQLYDGLTRYDLSQDGAIPPLEAALATSWKANSTATKWTFTLRDGVTFTDGTPFDADAVVFNLTRLTDPSSPYSDPTLVGTAATYAGTIDRFRKVDDTTVEITTKGPNAHLPYDMAMVFFGSPAAIKKDPKGFAAHPVGTGPFEFSSMQQGQQLTLKKNPHYWGGPPKLDELVLKPIPDATARIAALKSGSVDWIEYPTPDDVESLKASGDQVLVNSYDHVWPWVLNMTSGPLKDVRVRQALNHAIDREAMASALLHDTAEPAYQVAPRANTAYDPANDIYKKDPAKAKQLLAQAGYPKGFSMTVLYPTSGSGNMVPGPMNEALQKDLAAVGVAVKLKPIEWATLITQYLTGKVPAGVDAINASLTFQQESFWGSAFATGAPLNVGHYSNRQVDADLSKAATETDAAKRGELYRDAAGQITRDAPWLFVVNDRNPRALSPKVHDFVEPKSWFVDLTDVWVG
jgi:peptide/nickel transport system substrate-binding protein